MYRRDFLSPHETKAFAISEDDFVLKYRPYIQILPSTVQRDDKLVPVPNQVAVIALNSPARIIYEDYQIKTKNGVEIET